MPPLNLDEEDKESQQIMETPTEPLGGIAVNYSDPSEAEERRRLLMLINKSEATPDEPEATGRRKLAPRKSARQRGYQV